MLSLYPADVIDCLVQHAIDRLQDFLVGLVGSGDGDHIDHLCHHVDIGRLNIALSDTGIRSRQCGTVHGLIQVFPVFFQIVIIFKIDHTQLCDHLLILVDIALYFIHLMMPDKLSLPQLPYSLAVVSAPDAAGYGDFCRHLQENEYGFVFKVTLFPATMQGEKAAQSVADALAAIDPKLYDAALLMRGGGSRLDLACFDDYEMAAAIARCPIPVYTAIGHDRDHSVADMVAHESVKTPTALADEFIDLYAREDERLAYLANRLKLAFANKISSRLSRIDELERRIREADPRKVLQRGYSLIVDEGGHIVKEAASVKPGDKLRIMLADGTIEVNVDTVTSFPAPTGNLK